MIFGQEYAVVDTEPFHPVRPDSVVPVESDDGENVTTDEIVTIHYFFQGDNEPYRAHWPRSALTTVLDEHCEERKRSD